MHQCISSEDEQPFGSWKDLKSLKFSVFPVGKALGLTSWTGRSLCVLTGIPGVTEDQRLLSS